MQRFLIGVATTVVTAAMVMTGAAGTAAAASHEDDGDGRQVVWVSDGAHSPSVSKTWLHEGTINFKVNTKSANGLDVTLFKLRRGAHFADVTKAFQEEFTADAATAAKGTRDLMKAAEFYGLADVVPGLPVTVTERLDEGTYYAFGLDPNAQTPAPPTAKNVTVIHVVDGRSRDDDGSRGDRAAAYKRMPTIALTSADRFQVSGHLPARGSVKIKNVSDSIHIVVFQPVKPGTTDKQVQTYFDSGVQSPPPFAVNRPSIGMDVLSPWKQLVLSYSVPKGTYVLLCFVADDVTGMPHAVMGMHKVVTLS